MDLADYTATQILWAAAGLSALLAALAAWRDHARTRRRDLDRPGWAPWTGITILALLLAVVCAGLAAIV